MDGEHFKKFEPNFLSPELMKSRKSLFNLLTDTWWKIDKILNPSCFDLQR